MNRQSQEADSSPVESELVVTLNKEIFTVKTRWTEEGFTVDIDGKKEVVLNTDWLVGEPMMLADMNGKDVTIQVSDTLKVATSTLDDGIFYSTIVVEGGNSISDTMETR